MSVTLLMLIAIALVLWIISVLHALLVYENHRFVRGRMSAHPDVCSPCHATLIVPCKGNDSDLAENLRAYLRQDYPEFDAIFVVEDSRDAAVPIIETVRREFPGVPSRFLVAGPSEDSGQKIHNLLAAWRSLTAKTEILAFGDADAHPQAQWLRWFVARLHQPGAGAVTGYRWYHVRQFHWPALVVTALNNVILGWMGRGQHFLVWGGSWAIRRDLFDRIGTQDCWQGAISDDLVVSRCLREANEKIEFVPQCLCTSEPPSSWRGVLGFLQRQLTIVRCYQFRYWVFLLLVTLFHMAGLIASVVLIASATTIIGTILALASLFGLYALSILRGHWRYSAIQRVFPEAVIDSQTRRLDILGMPVLSLLGVGLIASSCWSNTIHWRGIAYHLDSRGNVVRLDRRPLRSTLVMPEAATAPPELLAAGSGPSGSSG